MENKTFEKYYALQKENLAPFLRRYKGLLTENRHYLLEVGAEIRAYDTGIIMQARRDFSTEKDEYLEGKSVIEFIEDNEFEIYDKSKTEKVKHREQANFKSSFENEHSKKLRKIVINEALSKIIPDNFDNKSITQIFKDFLFKDKFSELRRRYATKISSNYNQTIEKSNIFSHSFEEILRLSNKKYLAKDCGNLVIFLELNIEKYYPEFWNDLGIKEKINSLLEFRKQSNKQFNTLCWRCSKKLCKNDASHYCTRSENRACYEARFKECRDPGFPEAILKTKNKCDSCGKHCVLGCTHSIKGIEYQFCGNKCYEKFRKEKK